MESVQKGAYSILATLGMHGMFGEAFVVSAITAAIAFPFKFTQEM